VKGSPFLFRLGTVWACLAFFAPGCGSRTLTQPPDTTGPLYRWPSVSPDGTKIAYFHLTPSSLPGIGLYVASLNTGVASQVVSGIVDSPAWSPSGRYLAYHAGVIHAIILPTGQDTTLVPVVESFNPTWSISGDSLAYDSNENDPRGACVIWTLDLRSGVRTDISIHQTGEWRDPDWSHATNRLAHIRYLAGISGAEIFTMSVAGNDSARLTTNNVDDQDPTWSPSGDEIAWTRYPNIWIMNSDGSAAHRLTSGQDPAWFPSGDSLAFVDATVPDTLQLFVIAKDGTGRRPLRFHS